jgi:hypothetical protein
MKTFNILPGILLLGALLGSTVPARPAEPSVAAAKGVASVAPQQSALGTGWGQRKVIFAIDPLGQPAEFVNAYASQNPTNRALIVRDARKALTDNGSVGIGEFWYGHSGEDLELVISRYPDQRSLEKRWKELSTEFDAKAPAPKVGQSAAWLDIGGGAGAPGRMFVFRQGLFTGWVSCKKSVSGEPLMQLVKATADQMAKAAEPGGAANRSQPVGPDTNRTSAAAGSGR